MSRPCPPLLPLVVVGWLISAVYAQHAVPVDPAVDDVDPLARSLRQVPLGLRTTGEHTNVFAVPVDPLAPLWQQPTGLYQPYGQARYVYYRTGPGFRVKLDRLDYLVRVGDEGRAMNIKPRYDGEFIDLIGPNATFDLRPEWPEAPLTSWNFGQMAPMTQPAASTPPPPSAALPRPAARRLDPSAQQPIDARIDGRIDGRVP